MANEPNGKHEATNPSTHPTANRQESDKKHLRLEDIEAVKGLVARVGAENLRTLIEAFGR